MKRMRRLVLVGASIGVALTLIAQLIEIAGVPYIRVLSVILLVPAFLRRSTVVLRSCSNVFSDHFQRGGRRANRREHSQAILLEVTLQLENALAARDRLEFLQ
jgi:hypothetical protein